MSESYEDGASLPWSISIGGALMVLASLLYFFVGLPFFWQRWMVEIYQPWSQGQGIIIVRSVDSNFPLQIATALSILWLGAVFTASKPLRWSLEKRNKLIKPFMWMAIVALALIISSKPMVGLAGTYLTHQGYEYCSELSERDFWTVTSTYVSAERYCPK